MKILALETSTALGGVVLIEDGKILFEKESNLQRTHSDNLHPFIDECLATTGLKISDIHAFASGVGPGSFTGIRIALNSAKTFAYSQNKPLVGIDSLTLLAHQVQDRTRPVLAMINAHKNMVFCSKFIFENQKLKQVQGPEAVHIYDLSTWVSEPVTVIGDGYEAFRPHFKSEVAQFFMRETGSMDSPQARTLARLANEELNLAQVQVSAAQDFLPQSEDQKKFEWKSILPLYLRASEAEEVKAGIVLRPLK